MNKRFFTTESLSILVNEIKKYVANAILTKADSSHSHTITDVDNLQESLDGFATEHYVDTKVSDVVDSAPETLNTLNKLAAALGGDSNFSTNVAIQIDTISGLVGNVLVSEQINNAISQIEILPSDWSQNDETASDYVKNRTHYAEENLVTCFENDALEFAYGAFDYPMAMTGVFLMQDEVVKITFDGVLYERQVVLDDYYGLLIAGNKKFVYGEDTGEPFIYVADGKFLAVETEGTHSVKIEKLTTTYHKLPEEYMPDSYGEFKNYTYGELMNLQDRRTDWNAEDITNPEYIKNRPFYTEYQYEEFIGETTITTQPQYNCFIDSLMHFSEDTIAVMWDGVMYQCPYVDYSYNGGYKFGDKNLVEYPFYFYAWLGSGYVIGYYGEHTYSLHKVTKVVHQLDEKYIPDSIINKFDDAIDDVLDIVNQSISYKYPTVINSSPVWGKMVYGSGKFVNVRGNPYVPVYSEDGFNWTETTLPAGNVYKIAYGNGKFVIIDNTSVYCSTDAITWTETALSFACDLLTYADGRFVIVSKTRTAYSEDGVTWTETTSTLQSDYLYDIAYGNGRFVVVYSKGIACSEDGITWTSINSTGSNYSRIAYGNGKFVVCGSYANGTEFAVYSEDGITWKIGNNFYINGSASIAYGGNKFIVLSDEGEATYSEDGVNWSSKITLPYSDEQKWSIAYGNYKFIAVSIDSNKIIYSKDGIAWADKIEVLVQNDEDVTFKVRELLKVPEVDNTLSIGNAAADSKIVGDALSLKADKTDILSLRDEFILNSSTEGSTKKFKITIDDDGVLTATEIVE